MFDHTKLEKLRKKKGLSVSALMFELDKLNCRINRLTLRQYELGNTEPRASTLGTMAKFYGVSVNDFFKD